MYASISSVSYFLFIWKRTDEIETKGFFSVSKGCVIQVYSKVSRALDLINLFYRIFGRDFNAYIINWAVENLYFTVFTGKFHR